MKTSIEPKPQQASAWPSADDFFEALLDAHRGLNAEQSQALNARLILALAQRVNDPERLKECLRLAQSAAY